MSSIRCQPDHRAGELDEREEVPRRFLVACSDGTEALELVEEAHGLGKPVVAPHVENAESMAVVFQCGFDFIQGNFLQEPDIVMQFDFGDNEASMHIAQAAS